MIQFFGYRQWLVMSTEARPDKEYVVDAPCSTATGLDLIINPWHRPGKGAGTYPLVMTNIAIENDHRNSGFSH